MTRAIISSKGWEEHNIWQHTASTFDLYKRRAQGQAEEMDCAAQAADILSWISAGGDSLIDMGCGAGYFWHSLCSRKLDIEYHGIDATRQFIEAGKAYLPVAGLPAHHLHHCRAEDFGGTADHFLSMNFLSNIDHYHRILSRMLDSAKKSVILRESISDKASCQWVKDNFLDPGADLCVPVHVFDRQELAVFADDHGFDVVTISDRRCGAAPEMVIGYPHYWRFMVFLRKGQAEVQKILLKEAAADDALRLLPA